MGGRKHVGPPTRPPRGRLERSAGRRRTPPPAGSSRAGSIATAQVCRGAASGHPAPSQPSRPMSSYRSGAGKSLEAGIISREDSPAPVSSQPRAPPRAVVAPPPSPALLPSCGVIRGLSLVRGQGKQVRCRPGGGGDNTTVQCERGDGERVVGKTGPRGRNGRAPGAWW